jgi:hypothetical protein
MNTKRQPGKIVVVTLAGILAIGSVLADEKAPAPSKTEAISSKPPEPAFELPRRFNRSIDSLSPSFFNDGLGTVPFIPPPAPSTPAAAPSKRALELRDTQKNWIFATPDDMFRTKTIEEAMGVKEYGPDGKEKKPHSVLGAFLENKPRSDGDSYRERPSLEQRDNASFRHRDSGNDLAGTEDRRADETSRPREGDFVRRGTFRQNDSSSDDVNFAFRSPLEDRRDSFFSERSSAAPFQTDFRLERTGNMPAEMEVREKQQSRLAEFNNLYEARPTHESRGILNTASPFNDPLRPATGSTASGSGAAAMPDFLSRAPASNVPDLGRMQSAPPPGLPRPSLIDDRGPRGLPLPTIGSSGSSFLNEQPRTPAAQPSVLPFPQRPF